jgi:hypothetical protein
MLLASESDPVADARNIDAEVVGLAYHPGGKQSGIEPVLLGRGEFAYWAPIPDPIAGYRGMSWITPIVREVMGDSAARDHKLRFFEKGATPNMIVIAAPDARWADKIIAGQGFQEWVKAMKAAEPSGSEAYQTLYLAGGTQVQVVGKDLQQLDFKVTQGAGETRIAAAAGVHPVLVGLSEGMQGASLNAGNFQAATKSTANRTFRPLWRSFAGAIAPLIAVPSDAELWYDDRDIPFLAEDVKDRADVLAQNASTIRKLVEAGFEVDAVVDAVEAEDFARLKGKHTGLHSVQLQAPLIDADTEELIPTEAPTNGRTPVEA